MINILLCLPLFLYILFVIGLIWQKMVSPERLLGGLATTGFISMVTWMIYAFALMIMALQKYVGG
jgi:hypothetical protein